MISAAGHGKLLFERLIPMQSVRRLGYGTAALAACLTAMTAAIAQVETEHFESDVSTDLKPWTHLEFYNDPTNFQFAIISDNAGGTRPGVFADGIKKLNLLMPEFVMSVGDFIPGNTNDRTVLARDWAEFDEHLKPLKVPFFWVPGNHDINNDVMRDVWNNRVGVPFYSFVYKDVLFLALDSTGEKGQIVPEYQVEYMKQALAKNAAVRWTFVFLHHPLWLYDDPAGFASVQALLQGRPHTVIAGHTHHYLHERRDGANYYILGTTGGGSQLRGVRYGEFDHVTWVTVSDQGPVIANLKLDGILPHDVTTRGDYEITRALVGATNLPFTVLTDQEDVVKSATVYLRFRNPSKHQLEIKSQFEHGHQITMEPSDFEMTLGPRSEKVVEVAVESSEALPTDNPALLKLGWTMGYTLKDEEDLFLSGTRNIPLAPSNAPLIGTVAPEFVESVTIEPVEPVEGYTVRHTKDGSTPTVESDVFDAAFAIDGETTLKARRFNEKGHGTTTAIQVYKPVLPGTGLRYRYYEGTWTQMPEFSQLEPKFSGVASDLNVESRQFRPDNWGMVLEGDFEVDETGEYTFYLNSDDGSMLYLDDKLVINNDGDHSVLELNAMTTLSAGTHRLRLEFFDSLGEAILELDVEGPGLSRQPIPFARLSH